MPLESANFIADLVQGNPAAGDIKGEGDDHLRLIKKVLRNSFPNLSGAMNRLVKKNANYTVVATDNFAMFSCSSGLTLAMTAAATLGAGFMIGLHADGDDFTIDPAGAELINGETSLVISDGSWGYLFCDGTSFSLVQTEPAGLNKIYPIGSIYINAAVPTNPADLFGFGTWTEFGRGRVIAGVDTTDASFNTVEKTGGSKNAVAVAHTHTGTASAGGSHSHTQVVSGYDTDTGNGGAKGTHPVGSIYPYINSPLVQNSSRNTAEGGSHTHAVTVDSAGVSGVDANLQPYITVYMWKRIA